MFVQEVNAMDEAIERMAEEKRARNPYLDAHKIEMVAKKG